MVEKPHGNRSLKPTTMATFTRNYPETTMTRNFNVLMISLVLLFSSIATSGERYLLHLTSDGQQEAVPLRRGEKVKDAIARMDHGAPMRLLKTDGVVDSLFNTALDPATLNTNFGFNHQDVAFEFFVPPADGVIKEVWWDMLLGGDINKSQIRAWNANPLLVTLPAQAVEATGNMGWYVQAGDGDGGVTPYKADADAPGTFHAGVGGAAGVSFDPLGTESKWKPGGVQVTFTPNTWNVLRLSDVSSDSFKVVKGQPFGFTIQNSSPVGGPNGRMELYSAPAFAPYHSLKFYEIARTGNNDPGWWIRAYEWGEYVVVEYTGDRAPRIISVTTLFTTFKTSARTVTATVTDDNPGGGAAGVASVNLKWKKGVLGTYASVAMTAGGSNSYTGSIPGASPGDSIYYYVEATDVNANVSDSKPIVYTIFAKANDLLCLYNYRTPISGVTREQLVGLYLNGIDHYDIWDVGKNGVADLPDLLSQYDKVAEITGDGSISGKDVITPVGAWLATGTPAKPKLYFLSDQDHGWISNYMDTTFSDDNVHAKYFGVKTLGPQDYPYYQRIPNTLVSWPWNIIVDANATTDSITAFIARFESANNVTYWYHPSYELGSAFSNWMDEIKPTADAKVLFRDITGGHNRVVGVRKMAADKSFSTVYLAFDYLATDFRSDTSKAPAADPKYAWILDAGGNLLAKFFEKPFGGTLSAGLTSVVPNSALRGQTLPVTITGQNTSFRVTQGSATYDASHVWFSQGSSTINASSVSVSSATNLTANFTIPSGATTGSWHVNVEQPLSMGIVTLNNGFTINAGGGGLMSLSDAEVDFIGVRVGQFSDITFTIRDSSISSGNLTGTVSLSGTGFTILSGGGSFTLSPGQAWYVTVRYNAASAGFSRGTLTINNNSTNYPATAIIPVRGYGVQLASSPKKILFDTTHGFRYSLGFNYFSEFVKLLRSAGHTVYTDLFNLSGMDALITAVQQREFTNAEITQVQSFVSSGGTMLVLADLSGQYGYNEQNRTLSAAGWSTGIRVDSSLVSDASQAIYGSPNMIKIFNFPIQSDPLLQNVDTLGVFYSASLTVSSPAEVIASTSSGGGTRMAPQGGGLTTEGISMRDGLLSLWTPEVSTNVMENEHSSLKMVEMEQRAASPTTMIPIVAKVGIGSGQIVVIGDGNIFTDPFPGANYGGPMCIRYAANRIFALNIFQGGSLIPTPKILSVRDVPNDNGKQVFVRWKVDQPAVSSGIARFGVWRKDSVWTFLKDSVLTVNDTVFQFVAPTIYDSTKVSGMRYSVFRITAHSINPQLFSMSLPDSGFSVDNLAPSVPKGVGGSVQSGGGTIAARLWWNKVPEKDLRYYAVYRSETQDFVQVDSVTFIGASADTTYRDSTVVLGKRYYYRIVAFDWSGNRSDPSDQLALTVSSVGRVGIEIPKEFSIAQNYPNPFNPTTIIRYGVPAQSRVKIEIFNSIGQRVATLLDGEREAGYYEVEWNAAVASGIYIYRIEAVAADNLNNAFVQVKKMVFVR